MKKLICFGEALVDLLSNRLNRESESTETFTKYAGGAPANVAVAAAKLGSNSYFCGMLGNDSFGHFLKTELSKHDVNTDYVRFTSEAKTALAFVSLDNTGERSFDFYRDPGADMLFNAQHFRESWFQEPGIFHICSNSLTDDAIFHATKAGVALAEQAQWTISFDVNLRLNLWRDLTQCKPRVDELIQHADVIKMSSEELDFLCEEVGAGQYLRDVLSHRPSLVIVTDGGNPLKWYSKDNQGVMYPPAIDMVDATAAGDAFVGGLLFELSRATEPLGDTVSDPKKLEACLSFASACGAFAASRKGAFPSLPTQADLKILQGH